MFYIENITWDIHIPHDLDDIISHGFPSVDDTKKMGWWQATYEQYVGDLKLKLEKQVPGPLKGVVNW